MNENPRSGKRFSVVVAVFLAVLLWLYVINVENPSAIVTLRDVPITLQGVSELEERELLVTELDRDSMKLRVSGKRKAFLKLNQSQVSVRLDVSKIQEAGTYTLTGDYLISDASIRSAFSVSEADNFSVTVTVKERGTKLLSVRAAFDGTLATDYEIEALTATPQTIEITGPQDVIDRIDHAAVILEGEHVRERLVQEGLPVLLLDKDGNLIEDVNVHKSVSACTATMSLVRVFTLPLSVLVVPGGGAVEEDAQVTVIPSSITVSGDEALLRNLTALTIGRVELADIFRNQTYRLPITLPEGLVNRGEEDTATVLVSLRDLPMRAVTTSNIELLNVPDGYKATPVNRSIQVWLRGDARDLDRITGGLIRVLVNLEDLTPAVGQQRVTASVYLDADTQAVGIVGSDYSVAVELSR